MIYGITKNLSKMSHFEKVESYKHRFAIETLRTWIEKQPQLIGLNYPVNSIIEQPFSTHGRLEFVPDLTIFIEDDIFRVYEVFHTHQIDGFKLFKIQKYQYYNNSFFEVHEISAEWILRQVRIPDKLIIDQVYKDIRFPSIYDMNIEKVIDNFN